MVEHKYTLVVSGLISQSMSSIYVLNIQHSFYDDDLKQEKRIH